MKDYLPQPKPKKVVKTGKVAKPVKKKKAQKRGVPKNIRQRTLSDMQRLRKIQESINGKCVCISCGKVMTLGDRECQGGHYITRQNRATELEPDNIFPQCGVCNVLKSGNPIAYRFNLIKKIGLERVERLENMALARDGNEEALSKLSEADRVKATAKKTNKDYLALDTQIRQQIKELEKIGFEYIAE